MRIHTYLATIALAATMAGLSPAELHAADPAEAKTIGRLVRERPDLSSFLQLLEHAFPKKELTERPSRSSSPT